MKKNLDTMGVFSCKIVLLRSVVARGLKKAVHVYSIMNYNLFVDVVLCTALLGIGVG